MCMHKPVEVRRGVGHTHGCELPCESWCHVYIFESETIVCLTKEYKLGEGHI